MDVTAPKKIKEDVDRFEIYLEEELSAILRQWYREKHLKRDLFAALGAGGWFGMRMPSLPFAERNDDGRYSRLAFQDRQPHRPLPPCGSSAFSSCRSEGEARSRR